jgi:Cu-Zn family superoxide dismutase
VTTTRRRRPAAAAVTALALLAAGALAACGDGESSAEGGSLSSTESPDLSTGAADPSAPGAPGAPGAPTDPAQPGPGGRPELAASTALRDPDGVTVGSVTFEAVEVGTRVTVDILDGGEPSEFHGLHVHANDDPSNGVGCVADPTDTPGEWFVSADGHLRADPGDAHGDHQGDLPNLLVLADGTAATQFITDRLAVEDVLDAAVVLHARADNAGNVPTGTAEDEYTANSSAASDLTSRTGNAGDRIACGVVESGLGAGAPVR